MATAHAFRICENDYSGAAGSGWDDDPGVTTTVGGGNVVANFHVAKNWHAVCRAAVHRLKVSAGVSSGWRIVIIEYDTGDIISTTGAGATDTTMQDEETRTPVTDDKTRHLIKSTSSLRMRSAGSRPVRRTSRRNSTRAGRLTAR
jgi:hypothetical protein